MGINSLLQQDMQGAGLAGIDRLAGNAMFPQSQMDKTQYSVSSQMPTSAEVVNAGYEPKGNSYTGMPMQRFAKGGIATLRYEEGGETTAPWDPESGKVILQQFDPQNMSVAKTADYTIPKDDIQTFIPDMDTETGLPSGSGQYILNNGSKMMVDNTGTVIAATPARDEYTLNEQGYYQPTGSGLTWDGNNNMLTKKIGGIDVQVPGLYHKGGYQDEQGGLRLDQYGTPIALAPNYLDSGYGKSGLADAAPYIMMAALAAATYGAATPMMAGESAALMGPTYGELGITGLEAAGAMGPTYAEMGYTGLNQGQAIAAADAAAASAQGIEGLKDAYNVYKNVNRAKNVVNMLGGEGGGGTSATYGNQSINNPYAMSSGMTPTPTYNSGAAGTTGLTGTLSASDVSTNPFANLSPRINLSKLSDFKTPANIETLADGGSISTLGSYSDGGRLLKGPGDGMSDNIPAKIGQSQPARLADGEFVVPADVVSHLGNGSTDAGAKQLYAMMDKIRHARTGNKKQGKKINPSKFLPKG